MSRKVFWLVFVISCAHAMVHVYELALPSVEQLIAQSHEVTKREMGWLAVSWRLPFGFGALIAGWLTDRWGSRKMLAVYLIGCAAACGLAGTEISLPALFITMFAMGSLASIYHPAGLALISHETTIANRSAALGLHGIFGSLGIGGAPFLAAIVLGLGAVWRQYYLALAVPGLLLGLAFLALYLADPGRDDSPAARPVAEGETDPADWGSYFTLTTLATLMGAVYSAVLSFLPRYLGDAGIASEWVRPESMRNYLAGGVLLIGCFGQYYAGRMARPERLERQLTLILLANILPLAAMAAATGWLRAVAAALFALIHFMYQPIYNTLVSKYSPRRRRSFAYGFSFAAGLGLGSIGAGLAGYSPSDAVTHGTLCVLVLAAAVLGLMLCRRNPSTMEGTA
jgi:FSR family fosmidomycin resistance protein-like MFS transporter